LKKEVAYHLLEFLAEAGIVKKNNNKYYVDERTRTIASLIKDLEEPDITN
jgi:hypothetical protein